ncbi:hypothetical protein [Actinomadura opuntiae]|uniref:hypothetical protein n=1 Tax=Actinomadura sp. OS1-43 TaxID=604315 RepID=UPI00255AC34D|nr:hypothetical protein [Actinomadura sp. OS1-43]MDL4812750.1 hypothetical protein [Actinomadura sp. OS1-43]
MTTTAPARNPHQCPGCGLRPRAARQYLCRGCWVTLPAATRRALNLKDDQAAARLAELHRQLAAGVALHRIEIAAR